MMIKRFVRLSVIVLVLIFMLVGCTTSKAKYEAKMESTLKGAQEELAPIEKRLRKAGGSALEEAWADQEEVLEQTATRLGKITPPDDFFIGHSQLIEFLELIIITQQDVGGEDSLRKLTSSTSALSQALRELPFLKYEIEEAFGGLSGLVQDGAFDQRRPRENDAR